MRIPRWGPLRAVVAAALLVTPTAATVAVAGSAHAAVETCAQYGTVSLDGGRIIAQNNRWGASTPQCISADGTGFQVTRSEHNNATNGPPAAYPSVYKGCHYGNCTVDSGLPLQVSQFGDPRATYEISTPNSGEWNASFDLWYDANPNQAGQNTGAELMIWANHRGRPQPIGARIAGVNLEGGTWDVWFGNVGWNVISYVRTVPTNSMVNFSIKAFTQDAVNRGKINSSWYMTSVQAGFEPWIGGAGLAVNRFGFTTNGGTNPQPIGQMIRGVGSNRCVDVSGGRDADGTKIQLWDCHGGPEVRWRWQGSTLVNSRTGKCLDVAGNGTVNGTIVHLWTCLNNGAQQWQPQSNGNLRNPQSGKCLDARERGTANGTQLQIWDCGTGSQPQQQWRFE